MQKMHFISGLPRSGSTLLASLLNQNPAFHASIMSPVGQIVTEALEAMGPKNEAQFFIGDPQRYAMLRYVFAGYYGDHEADTIFDNNRRWCANTSLVKSLFPGSKIICCVRHPAAIADSFERLFRANPLHVSKIYGATANYTVYDRVRCIMQNDGVLGFSLNAFRDAFFGPDSDILHLVYYDDLARFPERVLTDLHKALKLKPYPYRFDKIDPIPGAKEFDARVSTPGLHDLKASVVYEQRPSILPPDLYNHLPKPFWLPAAPVKETATKPS